MSTRWDESNTAAQCSSCNRFHQGEIQNFRQGLIKRYGVEAVDKLELKKFIPVHFSAVELQVMIDLYTAKNKAFLHPEKDSIFEGNLF